MDSIFTYCQYVIAAGLLILSFIKNKEKTSLALKKTWKMFLTVLPQFLAILCFVGLLLAVIKPETIRSIVGTESGAMGMILSALIGAVALVPVFIAYPIVSELLKNGAGIMQMAVFISTLTTVGFVTIPLEFKYLGKKASILRNMLAFLFSFVAAYVIEVVST